MYVINMEFPYYMLKVHVIILFLLPFFIMACTLYTIQYQHFQKGSPHSLRVQLLRHSVIYRLLPLAQMNRNNEYS